MVNITSLCYLCILLNDNAHVLLLNRAVSIEVEKIKRFNCILHAFSLKFNS